jgi:outer membrane cobalamin receptor
MRLRVWPTVVFPVGILISLAVFPATGQEPPVFELPEVVVPGKRPQPVSTTPAYVTVIPKEELQRMGFLTLGDALQFVSEVYTRTAGSGPGGLQQASIRGSTPQQVLVLIDGVPLNATAQFGVNLSTIALADVERVEVLRGPYSAIYGSGALGGVIQVVTRADDHRLASGRFGSYGTVQSELRLGRSSSGGAFGLGTRYLSTAGDRPNSDMYRWTTNARLVSDSETGQSLMFTVHRTSAQSGVPGSTSSPTASDRLDDARTILSLTWTQLQSSPSRRQGRVWWLGDELHSLSPSFTSDSAGSAFGAEWQSVVQLDSGSVLTSGIEWQQARFKLASTSAFGTTGFESSGSTAAGYVQYDAVLGQKTFAGIGTRYDYHSVYGGQLNPRLGIVHFLTSDLRLRASIGHTFRGPTFGELFFPGCSNQNLKPERAWAGDIGLEATVRSGLVVRLNEFYTDATDLIVGGCNPQNVGSARMAGLSLETVGHLNERWAINTNLTWSDGIDRTTGLSLLRLPPLQVNIVLRYLTEMDRALSFVASYVSERPDLDFSTFPATRVTLPGYATFGLRYEQALGNLILRAGVDNLVDAHFETLKGYPGLGRTFFIQVGGEF